MKTAIITGASSGLGVEFAKLVEKTYPEVGEIWLLARRKDRLEALAKELGEDKFKAVPIDLCDENALSGLFEKIKASGAEIELLINNAGFGKLGDVADSTAKSQTDMIDLNVKALTALTAEALKHMNRGSGILNVCSIAAFAPNPRLTVYSSTKAYVMSFTKGLSKELKPRGIGCCCVCPGPMRTEFLEVANIGEGASKAFDLLPYCDLKKVAKGALSALKKGRTVYTPRVFYKFYRVLAKLLPHGFIMKFSGA